MFGVNGIQAHHFYASPKDAKHEKKPSVMVVNVDTSREAQAPHQASPKKKSLHKPNQSGVTKQSDKLEVASGELAGSIPRE